MGRNTADVGLAGRVTTTGLAQPWPLSENCSRQGKLRGPDSGRVQSGSQPPVPNMARAKFRGWCCLLTQEGQGFSVDQTGLYPGGWVGQGGWGASHP